jgi:hypothetical protein
MLNQTSIGNNFILENVNLLKEYMERKFLFLKKVFKRFFIFIYLSTFLYLKFLLIWSLIMIADFLIEFRFEFLWPLWLFMRSIYDSFKYQGLVSFEF